MAVILLGVLLGSGIVHAKDLSARTELDSISRTQGIGKDVIEMLYRREGPGAYERVNGILERFLGVSGAISMDMGYDIEIDHNNVKLIGDSGWFVKAWGEGDEFQCFNFAYTVSSNYKKMGLKDRFSSEALEEIGRRFIEKELVGIVNLAEEEDLVALRTQYEVEGGIDNKGCREEETVVSSVIVFGRRVSGIDIVGPGSKIAIFVANDGQVFGFDGDWPQYDRTTETQSLIPIEEVYERLSAYGLALKYADKTEIHRFECGYFDAGERDYDRNSLIQSGCFAQVIGKKMDSYGTEIARAPVVNVIPMGRDVVWDEGWRESQLINLEGDICAETDLSLCIPGYEQGEPGPDE
jgi:hypothetical protein